MDEISAIIMVSFAPLLIPDSPIWDAIIKHLTPREIFRFSEATGYKPFPALEEEYTSVLRSVFVDVEEVWKLVERSKHFFVMGPGLSSIVPNYQMTFQTTGASPNQILFVIVTPWNNKTRDPPMFTSLSFRRSEIDSKALFTMDHVQVNEGKYIDTLKHVGLESLAHVVLRSCRISFVIAFEDEEENTVQHHPTAVAICPNDQDVLKDSYTRTNFIDVKHSPMMMRTVPEADAYMTDSICAARFDDDLVITEISGGRDDRASADRARSRRRSRRQRRRMT